MECTGKRFYKHGFEFPCGQCMVCRLRNQRTWVGRILLEAALHRENSFVTLTYSDDELPADRCVSVHEMQLWVKRLRKLVPPKSLRYVVVGEYGEEESRPHYHAALFGLADASTIERSWAKGFVSVQGIGPESAAYIVSYILKRRNSEERCEGRSPEFKLQSLRPAIGLRAAERMRLPAGREVEGVRINGRIYPLGRYLKDKVRTAQGINSETDKANRHRMSKIALQVRDPEEHKTKVENAKRVAVQIQKKRREKRKL